MCVIVKIFFFSGGTKSTELWSGMCVRVIACLAYSKLLRLRCEVILLPGSGVRSVTGVRIVAEKLFFLCTDVPRGLSKQTKG